MRDAGTWVVDSFLDFGAEPLVVTGCFFFSVELKNSGVKDGCVHAFSFGFARSYCTRFELTKHFLWFTEQAGSESHDAFCDHCADGFVEFHPSEETAWLAFRDRVDAAEVADLARIRKKLKLSQLEAARLAGGGKNAFSRYERGQARPVAAVINLFRLLDGHPELLSELRT